MSAVLLSLALLAAALPAETGPLSRAAQAPQPTTPAPLPDGAVEARYDLRVLGVRVGRPTVRLGAARARARGEGGSVRTLELRSGLAGIAHRVYGLDWLLTAMLDGQTARPLESRLVSLRGGGAERRATTLRFAGHRLEVEIEGPAGRRRQRRVVEPGTTDPVTSLLWLQTRALPPGASDHVAVHTGRRHFRMVARAVAREEVAVPAGVREATRVECALHPWWPARLLPTGDRTEPARPRYTFTVWLADDPWRTPLRIETLVGHLGRVTAELTDKRLP